jgi:hypothetical protein
MGDIAPQSKLKRPYVRPIIEALKTVELKRSGTYIPRDILNPFPTDSINPATKTNRIVLICLKYMNHIKKICLFLRLNIYYTPSWVILKNTEAEEKSVHEKEELKEELKRNSIFNYYNLSLIFYGCFKQKKIYINTYWWMLCWI